MRRTTIALLLLSAACTGGGGAGPAADAPSRTPRAKEGVATSAPDAQATVGTKPQIGSLTEWCRRGSCESAAAAPQRFVRSEPGDRLVVFALEVLPEQVALVARTPKGKVVERSDLEPGIRTPVYRLDVPPGRYVVELEAVWKEQRARWAFGFRFA